MTLSGRYATVGGAVRQLLKLGESGGGVVPPPAPLPGELFTASPTFSLAAPTWRDGTAITGDALTSFQRVQNRVEWYLNDYQAGVIESAWDIYATASGGNSYAMTRHMTAQLQGLAMTLAVTGWDAIPKLFAEAWNKMAQSRTTGWANPTGSNPVPGWTETNYYQWLWKENSGNSYYGRDVNYLEEELIGFLLALVIRICYDNRGIAECNAAYLEAKDHLVNHHLPKYWSRLAAYEPVPGGHFYKESWPFVRGTYIHMIVPYLLQLSLLEPLAGDAGLPNASVLPTAIGYVSGELFGLRYGQSLNSYYGSGGSAALNGGLHTISTPDGEAYVCGWGTTRYPLQNDATAPGYAKTSYRPAFSQYWTGIYRNLSLLGMLRPDVFGAAVMGRFVNSMKHTYWRKSAAQLTGKGDYDNTWLSQDKSYYNADGTTKVAGQDIVTNEGPTIPKIWDLNERTPEPIGNMNTSNPMYLAAWDASLLDYATAVESINGMDVPNPPTLQHATAAVFAYGAMRTGALS